MNTFLGTDDSPSDRLVINGGPASGNSLLRIANAGGPGELTTANGIQVVSAVEWRNHRSRRLCARRHRRGGRL